MINCEECGKPLHRQKWNSTVDVLVCPNRGCPTYGQHQATERRQGLVVSALGRWAPKALWVEDVTGIDWYGREKRCRTSGTY